MHGYVQDKILIMFWKEGNIKFQKRLTFFVSLFAFLK